MFDRWSNDWKIDFFFCYWISYLELQFQISKYRYAHIDILLLLIRILILNSYLILVRFGFGCKNLHIFMIKSLSKWLSRRWVSDLLLFCYVSVIIALKLWAKISSIRAIDVTRSKNQVGKFRVFVLLHQLRIQCFINHPLTLTLPVLATAVKLILCLRIFCIFFYIFDFSKNRRFCFRLFSCKCFKK